MTSEAKSILVTGGAGFIGSHLCERLLNAGNNVICVDNMLSGVHEHIAPLLDNERFTFLQADIIDPNTFSSFEDIDEIYNLACPASPPFYQADPLHTMKTSVYGIFNVLDLAHRCGARVLHTSTSEVYGDPLEHPQHESYRGNVNPIGPRSCYDEGKRAAEAIMFDHRRTYGTDVKIVRIFNTYGPRMRSDDGRVVSNFIMQALKNEDITVYGDGSQTRSFCYVDDLVDGLLKMMAKDGFTGPVNLGNPDEFTVGELANIVIDMTGSSSKVVNCDLPIDDPVRRKPAIELAKEQLGWAPRVPLKDGLRKTIEYFSQINNR